MLLDHPVAAQCAGAPDQAYRFDVRIEIPAARLNRGKSRADLTGLALHGEGTSTLGLMQSQLEFSNRLELRTLEQDGGHCYWIRSIDLLLRYRSLDIFVASDYRRDSCAFRAILSHERDHVRVARQYLNRFETSFHQALNSSAVPTPSRPAFTRRAPKAEAQDVVSSLIQPVFEELNAAMSRAQAALDTPEQYARIRSACSDW